MNHPEGYSNTSLPSWQLPEGVSPGTWDYTQKHSIAADYDEYFDSHPLFALDASLIEEHIPEPKNQILSVADFGCGTARALIPLVRDGFHGLAIDLSQPMLDVVAKKSQEEGLPIDCVRANLVDLHCLCDDCVDHGICLFSTLGMIRGRRHRVEFLRHARRIIRPGGRFIVHVHNTWAALHDPGGLRWLVRSAWRNAIHDGEFGDRLYPYRGLPNMYLHNYRLSELRCDLQQSGFSIAGVFPIDRTATGVLRCSRLLPAVRAGGFIAVCE